MDNLELYNKVRSVPKEAQKTITAGRLKGMTDINPMWRIQVLTERFGVCGIGWKTQIIKSWIDEGANNEKITNVEILLYVKIENEWSEGIPGIGGSKFIAKETGGLYTDDECYKKAYTDALSVACKALGIGADIYFQKGISKYSSNENNAPERTLPQTPPKAQERREKSKWAIITELIRNSSIQLASVNEWIAKKFGKSISINNLTDEQFNLLTSALKKQIARESSDE